MKLITVDFETYYDQEFSLSKVTTEEYIRDPRFEVIGLSIKVDDGEAMWGSGTHEQIKAWLHTFDWSDAMLLAHNCVTGDHEVRTPDGWVRLDALKDGTPVLQWDHNTAEYSWVVPNAVVRKPYSGNMLAWNTSFHKGIYTPEHRMYYQTPESEGWRVREAETVAGMGQNNTYIPTGGFLAPSQELDMRPEVARVMEMLRADAHINPTSTHARMKFRKERKIIRARKLLDLAGVPYTETDYNDTTCFGIGSCPELKQIKELLGADKAYGPWVLELPFDTREALIDELQYWDGVRNSGAERGGTNSKAATTVHTADYETAHWLYELATLSGYTASTTFDTPNTRGFSRPDSVLHRVSIRPRQRVKLVERPEEVEFNGTVYCVTVPTGAFLVRRDGAAWVTGNCMFDGAILSWVFDVHPKALADTLCMGRALDGVDVGGSLAAMAKRYGLGEKGHEVIIAKGMRRADFTPEALSRYGDYCINDVELTYGLFKKMAPSFPKQEMKLIDLTLRMFTEPVLELDKAGLEEHLKAVRHRKNELLIAAGVTDKKDLMSNNKFADMLRELGVEPPMKVSPATLNKPPEEQKMTYAFAKTDEAFKALEDHPDDRVGALVAARLGNKSTLEETRTERFIGIAERGKFPVPIKYYAAHTGRWGGADKVNVQNLPSRGPNAKAIKNCIVAPEGYVLVDCDSSQIEARVLAWLAGQWDLVEAFANKEDVYIKMASRIYGKPEDQIDKNERFVGKTTILGAGYGMGAVKFQAQLKSFGFDIELDEARRIIDVYRSTNDKIKDLWDDAKAMLGHLANGQGQQFGREGVLFTCPVRGGVQLPSELFIYYPNLRYEQGEMGPEYWYATRKGEQRTYGGKVVENVVQGIARCVVGEQMLRISKRYKVALTVHDSVVSVVPEAEAVEGRAWIEEQMRYVPDWAEGLPVDCESDVGRRYGEE